MCCDILKFLQCSSFVHFLYLVLLTIQTSRLLASNFSRYHYPTPFPLQAPRLTDVHASLSPGSCLQNVTLVFNADTSAPVVEIQHDLRFLLHFDPPELNWVAHRGLWLDFRTLVVVFDECVVWEGATSSGRERPMFVAFEALRGGCLSVCLTIHLSVHPSM